ncbi:MAG TPA: hypothetical protein PK177_23750, partial [Burkholderiaceae bacterium]|nr:hypothetical protein [Burkholderiaceae bacterium]
MKLPGVFQSRGRRLEDVAPDTALIADLLPDDDLPDTRPHDGIGYDEAGMDAGLGVDDSSFDDSQMLIGAPESQGPSAASRSSDGDTASRRAAAPSRRAGIGRFRGGASHAAGTKKKRFVMPVIGRQPLHKQLR